MQSEHCGVDGFHGHSGKKTHLFLSSNVLFLFVLDGPASASTKEGAEGLPLFGLVLSDFRYVSQQVSFVDQASIAIPMETCT